MSDRLREPIFETLDAMIAMGYGNVPQTKIPENWRDIPHEVNQQDLDRVRAEELIPEKERIAAIEDSNQRSPFTLGELVMQEARERRKRGRPRVQVSEAWLELVAVRRARKAERKQIPPERWRVTGESVRARRANG